MNEDVKHIIITRVGLKKPQSMYDKLNIDWNNWLENSINLMNGYCRASLRNQTNQNFTLLSIFDESVTEYGDVLPNEIIVKSKIENEPIKKIIKRYAGGETCDKFIMTRLDRDDCLRYDFVDKVQHYLKGSNNKTYVDISHDRLYLDLQSNTFYRTFKPRVSPFASTLEKNKGLKTSVFPFCIGGHTSINNFCQGAKYTDIVGLTVIHNNNVCNNIEEGSIKTECNPLEFGLKEFNVKGF